MFISNNQHHPTPSTTTAKSNKATTSCPPAFTIRRGGKKVQPLMLENSTREQQNCIGGEIEEAEPCDAACSDPADCTIAATACSALSSGLSPSSLSMPAVNADSVTQRRLCEPVKAQTKPDASPVTPDLVNDESQRLLLSTESSIGNESLQQEKSTEPRAEVPLPHPIQLQLATPQSTEKNPVSDTPEQSTTSPMTQLESGTKVKKDPPKSVVLPKSAMKSSLKSSKTSSNRRKAGLVGKPTTERRVRGLWNDSPQADSYFSKLREETVSRIFGFLNLADLLRAGMVAPRYHSIVQNHKTLWNRIDATEFVHTAHTNFLLQTNSLDLAQKLTGEALEKALDSRSPKSLIIRDIHRRLSPDSYLPTLTSLRELCLTHYEDITDTHVHVLLLMTQSGSVMPKAGAQKRKPGNSLRSLHLGYSPKLTNATVRSIASQCRTLHSLNLQGCQGISNLEPLAPLLSVTEIDPAHEVTPPSKSGPPSLLLGMFAAPPAPSLLMNMFAAPSAPQSQPPPPPPHVSAQLPNLFTPPQAKSPTPLSNLFAPPPPPPASKPAPLPNLFTPPPTSAAPTDASKSPPPPSTKSSSLPTSNSLQSLFAPPGNSPPRPAPTVVPKPKNVLAAKAVLGNLQDLDIRGTGVTPTGFLQLLKAAGGNETQNQNSRVKIKAVRVEGRGFSDSHLDQVSNWLVWDELEEFAIESTTSPINSNNNDNSNSNSNWIISPPMATSTLSDKTLERWAAKHCLSQLTYLNLSGQTKLSLKGLDHILQQTPKLEQLIMRQWPNLFQQSDMLKAVESVGNNLDSNKCLRLVDFRESLLEPDLVEFVMSKLLTTDYSEVSCSDRPQQSLRSPAPHFQLLL